MKARLLKKFEDEIQALDKELKTELPKEIQRARELGDLRENAEYQAAKERQRLVESRISMLQKRVSEISLMNLERIPHDKVGFGSTVHLKDGTGQTIVYQLVMPEDANVEAGADLHGVTDRTWPAREGRGGRGQHHRPQREPSLRARQSDHDPRRVTSFRVPPTRHDS